MTRLRLHFSPSFKLPNGREFLRWPQKNPQKQPPPIERAHNLLLLEKMYCTKFVASSTTLYVHMCVWFVRIRRIKVYLQTDEWMGGGNELEAE